MNDLFKVLIISLFMSGPALADCSTGSSATDDCLGGLKDSVPDVINTEPDEGADRAVTVGGAVKECIECILEGLENDLKKITTQAGDAVK